MPPISKRAALLVAGIAFGGAALVFGGAAVADAVGAHSREITAFRGVRLGMSARDVRDRFEPPGLGRWQMGAEESEMILAWASDLGDARMRFEFHSGMLVAIRADLPRGDSLASGAPIEISPAAVLTRRPAEPARGSDHVFTRASGADPSMTLTILARDCPTHAAEVQRVLAANAPR